MNKLKVGFISNLFPSQKDPTFGSFVGKNYKQLQDMGFEVGNPVVMDTRLPPFKKLLAYICFFKDGMKLCFSSKYDYIYIHYLTYSTLCLLPVLLFKRPKYVVNIHGDDLVGTRLIHKIMSLPSPIVLKFASAVVVPSSFFKSELLKRFPTLSAPVIISESAGFDESVFYPRKNELTNNEIVHFGYVSRIDEGKGWEELLSALNLLKINNSDLFNRIKLSFYGKGGQVNDFNKALNYYDLKEIVTYYGPVAPEELGEIYRSFDYFIFPTHRESFGLVAVEACACGIPVLASDISPVNNIIYDGVNGFLFESNNASSIYNTLLSVFKVDYEAYVKMSQAACESVVHYRGCVVASKLAVNLHEIFGNTKF